MAEENIDLKLRVDASDYQNATQQIAMSTQSQLQQITMLQMQSLQAASMAAMQAPNMTPMSPTSAIAQQMYSSGISQSGVAGLESGMANFYGSPIMSPYQRVGAPSSYPYPYGFIPGPPPPGESHKETIVDSLASQGAYGAASTFANTGVGNAMLSSAPAQFMGFQGGASFPLAISGPLDLPVFRQQQMLSEKFAEASLGFKMGMQSAGATGLGLAGAAATMFAPLGVGIPAALGVMGLGVAADTIVTGRKEYRALGDYYRDSMAPYMRQRLGGGPSYDDVGNFQRKFSGLVKGDQFFTRDDFTSMLQAGTDAGLMQTSNSSDKVIQKLDKLSKNLKTLYALDMKMQDTMKSIDFLADAGIDAGGDSYKVANFMSNIANNAFSGGTTVERMIPGLQQAGGMYAQQGVAANIGMRIHGGNVANVGEAIRMGGFSLADLSYYGGREGLSNSITTGLASMQRSPLGQLSMMQMMKYGDIQKGQGMGTMSMGQLTNRMDISPEEYMGLNYRMPEFTKDMDPNALGMGQVATLFNTVRETMGKDKLPIGLAFQVLMRSGNMSPDNARSILRTIENGDIVNQGTKESLGLRAQQQLLEQFRPAPNIITNPKLWFQKTKERMFEDTVGSFAGADSEYIGHVEHKWLEKLTRSITGGGHTVHVHDGLTGVKGAINRMVKRQADEDAGLRGDDIYTTADATAEYQRRLDSENSKIVKGLLPTRHMKRNLLGNIVNDNYNDDTFLGKGANKILEERRESMDKLKTLIKASDPGSGGFVMDGSPDKKVSTKELEGVVRRIEGNKKITDEDMMILKDSLQSGSKNNPVLTKSHLKRIERATKDYNLTQSDINRLVASNENSLQLRSLALSEPHDTDINREMNSYLASISRDTMNKQVSELAQTSSIEELVTTAVNQITGENFTTDDINKMKLEEPKTIQKAMVNVRTLLGIVDNKDSKKVKKFLEAEDKNIDGRSKTIANIQDEAYKASRDFSKTIRAVTDTNISSLNQQQVLVAESAFAEKYFAQSAKDAGSHLSDRHFIHYDHKKQDDAIKSILGDTELGRKWKDLRKEIESDDPKTANEKVQSFFKMASAEFGKEKRKRIGDDASLAELNAAIQKSNVKGANFTDTSSDYADIIRSARNLSKMQTLEGVAVSDAIDQNAKLLKHVLGSAGIRMGDFLDTIDSVVTAGDRTTQDKQVDELIKGISGGGWFSKENTEFGGQMARVAKDLIAARAGGKSVEDLQSILKGSFTSMGLSADDGSLEEMAKVLVRKEGDKFQISNKNLLTSVFEAGLQGKNKTAGEIVAGGPNASKVYLDDSATKAIVQSMEDSKQNAELIKNIKDMLESFPETLKEKQQEAYEETIKSQGLANMNVNTFNQASANMNEAAVKIITHFGGTVHNIKEGESGKVPGR